MARTGSGRVPSVGLAVMALAVVVLVAILAGNRPASGLVAVGTVGPSNAVSPRPSEQRTSRPSPAPTATPSPTTPPPMVYEDAEAPFGIAYAPGDGYTGVTRGWPNSIDPSVHAVTLVGSCAYDFCPERVTISAARFDVGPLVGVNPVRRLPGVSLNELRTGWDATMGNETAPAERLRVDGEDALLVRSGDARAIVLTHRGWAYSIVYTGIRDLVGSTFLIEAASTIRFGYSVPPLDGSRIVFKEAHFAAVVPDDWKVLVNGESVSIGMRYGLGPTWDPTWTRYVLVASELTTLAAALAKAQDHGAVAGVLTFLAGDPGWLLTVPRGGRPPVALVEHGGRVFRFTVVDLQTPGVGATDLGRFLEGFEPLP